MKATQPATLNLESNFRPAQLDEKARFALLVNEVVDYAIFMLDPKGRVTTWNKGAERIKGYRSDEIVGQHFSRFYPLEDILAGKCERELTGAIRDGRFEDEGWRVRKDGTQFWANVVITALRDQTGQLQGFAKVTRDLTVRRQAEEMAQRLAREEAARTAAQSAQARAQELLFRTQGLQETTAAFGEALTREQVLSVVQSKVLPALRADGGSIAILMPDEVTLELVWTQGYTESNVQPYQRFPVTGHLPHSDAVRTRQPVFLENLKAINDAYPNIAMTNKLEAIASIPLMIAGRCIGVLGATRSNPARFTDEEERFALALAGQCAQALERARILQLERQRSDFAQELVAIVSHDLRSPISAMLLAAGTVLRRPDLEERLRVTINRILSSGERANRLIRDILDFTQARAGSGIPIQRQHIDLSEFLSLVVDEIRVVHPDRKISIHQQESLEGNWDPDRMAQIITNLVSNALQHGSPETSVDLHVTGAADSITLCVTNYGNPIPADEIPLLFEAYRRGRRTEDGARKSQGIGLGLYITRQLVEAHQGTIAVESDASTTTFTITLPK